MGNGNNWFDPRPGKKPARFVGREDVLRDIAAELGDRDENERIMLLTGVRGSGKTSVLAEARTIAENSENRQDISFFIDDAGKSVPGLKDVLVDYGEWVKRGGAPMLLMAGLPPAIEELVNDSELAFLKRARRVTLGNVREDEVFALFRKAFSETEKALRRAAEATMGYPYLIQLIGYYLSKEEKAIDDKAVDKAVFLSKIEMYKNLHEPIVWGLSSKDRMFLWAMAQDGDFSEFGEITRRMDVSAGYASKYRERLINAAVIYRRAYGELAFTLPYMRDYLEKEYIERLGGEGGKRRL